MADARTNLTGGGDVMTAAGNVRRANLRHRLFNGFI